MNVIVTHLDRGWHVQLAGQVQPSFHLSGADAFDAACRLAEAFHRRTGGCATVDVRSFQARVEVARFG
ncbi:hypothetical protein [Stenotrophomonas sp. 24(2023)]|uniref:hypothetical protein n=1 Tax=Stenotrophomonas sp. 24(2023) TaxID=3068324 RepID=UPI0027E008FA|nr:hypothetical protein [Stenotrophomonas sp. 24(2023)]WMJ69899.1 hypothetical protein Q9R17_01980 [Stenotrophomonas sp. 24(2023)]